MRLKPWHYIAETTFGLANIQPFQLMKKPTPAHTAPPVAPRFQTPEQMEQQRREKEFKDSTRHAKQVVEGMFKKHLICGLALILATVWAGYWSNELMSPRVISDSVATVFSLIAFAPAVLVLLATAGLHLETFCARRFIHRQYTSLILAPA